MTRDQKIVAAGAASGVAAMILSMWGLYQWLPVPLLGSAIGDRIGYAAAWNAVAVLPLLAGVIAIGNARATSEAIDPLLGRESKAMKIDGRVLDNSVQQFVLFAVASLALVAKLPAASLQVIPAAAMVFVVARALFWIGYRIHPLYRAFGMAATIYLNIAMLGAALWLQFGPA